MPVNVTFLGHAGFLFESDAEPVCIDPFLTGNPLARHKPEDVSCGVIGLTHGHEDHVGDSFAIAKNNDATIIAAHEIATWAESEGLTAIGVWKSILDPWGWVLEGSNVLFYPSAIVLSASLVLWAFMDEDHICKVKVLTILTMTLWSQERHSVQVTM